MNSGFDIDVSPIFALLLEIDAKIDALTDSLIDPNDKALCKKLDDAYEKHIERLVTEYKKTYPRVFDKVTLRGKRIM